MSQSVSPQPSSKIFISYRRDDSAGHAGRLFDRLSAHFGADQIFMDIEQIEAGVDFVHAIQDAVGSCEILVALIGKNWLASLDETGRRLDNPNDFVRLEIAAALERDVRVIPVLLHGASMPRPHDLPEDMSALSHRNAIELSDTRWKYDVDGLIAALEKVLDRQREAQRCGEEAVAERQRLETDARQREADAAEAKRREAEAGETQRREAEERRRQKAEEESRQLAATAAQAITEGPSETAQPDSAARGDAGTPLFVTTSSDGRPAPSWLNRRVVLAASAVLALVAVGFIVRAALKRSEHNPAASGGNQAAQQTTPAAASPQPAAAQPSPAAAAAPPPGANATRSGGEAGFNSGETTLWKRENTEDVLQIVRDGNTVTALMESPSASAAARGRRKGDLAFEGTYEGRTIRGTAYLLFSDTDVRRCPAFGGDQRFALDLTLSADGNTLSGSRDDYKLSADCTIIPLPRRRLTYTKASS